MAKVCVRFIKPICNRMSTMWFSFVRLQQAGCYITSAFIPKLLSSHNPQKLIKNCLGQVSLWILTSLGSLHHEQTTRVLIWETKAENILARSLCLTLLRDMKGLLGGSSFVTVSLWLGLAGGPWPTEGSHPCKHLYKHFDASYRTHMDSQKPKLSLVTRGWAGLFEETRWSEKS